MPWTVFERAFIYAVTVKRIRWWNIKPRLTTCSASLMAGIKNEVLSNLFRSTTNLMAFEQFLSSLPFNIAQRPESGQLAPNPGGPLPRREHLALAHEEPEEKNGDELRTGHTRRAKGSSKSRP